MTRQAHARGIPVFTKENPLPILDGEQMVQELPSAFQRGLAEQAHGRGKRTRMLPESPKPVSPS